MSFGLELALASSHGCEEKGGGIELCEILRYWSMDPDIVRLLCGWLWGELLGPSDSRISDISAGCCARMYARHLAGGDLWGQVASCHLFAYSD